MKKTELKVGEEYAVLLSPGAVRRFTNGRHYSSDKPLRVKLLAVDAVENLWDRGGFGGTTYSKRNVKGHKVTIPTNSDFSPTLRITIYKTALEPSLTRQEVVKGYSGTPTNMVQADWTRDFLLLENAGCFISTWAKYEQDIEDTKKMKERHAEEARAKRLANDAKAPAMEAKLERVLAKLAEHGEVKYRTDYVGNDTRYIEVEAFGGFLVKGEKLYVNSETEKNVLGGASFKMNLTTLAWLLGVSE